MERELLRLSETPLHLEKTWESGGVPVLTAEDPLTCVVRGCGIALEKIDEFEPVFSYE